MAVTSVALTEEECYLVALIEDHSGIDMAEFLWEDPTAENDEKIFRAWEYQIPWWRKSSRLFIDACARAVGKTQSIILRAWAFPIQFPGFEMVLTAPELIHLNPLTSRVEDKIKEIRLTRELLPGGVGKGFTHRPFQVNFVNGTKILGRIPQKDGKGVKGLHPLRLEMDEAQDYPEPGWTELIETLRYGQEQAQWRAHGVSKGIGGRFQKVSSVGSGWEVERITAIHRTDWSNRERTDKIALYGGRDSPDYLRNILGLHGDATNPLFVLHRLMACVDDNEGSTYNQDIYYKRRINDEMIAGRDILDMIDPPRIHTADWKVFWMGMDVGLTNHPSEILIFGEENLKIPKLETRVALRLLTRINMRRIRASDQRKVIVQLINFYKPRKFAMDRTGLGHPVYQDLQDENPDLMRVITGYAFNEKLVVGYEEYEETEKAEDHEIKRVAQEHAYDLLRTYVDGRRLILPFDTELLGEWNGQTWIRETATTRDAYGKKRFAQGAFHTLDAGGMAVLAKEMAAFDKVKEMTEDHEPIGVAFV
jgi:hypothetical protein